MPRILTLDFLPLGARYMLLSAFAFSIMAVFVKAVGGQGIPVLEIVAARSIISLILSYVTIKRAGIDFFGQRKCLLFARGLIGFIALNCVFYSVIHLPLAEATVLQYLHPMFTAILALFILKERPTWGTLICIILSLLGLIIIVQPSFIFTPQTQGSDNFPIAVAIAGAFGSALAYTTVRNLNKTEHPQVIVLYFPMIALPASLLFLWNDFIMPEGITWVYLLAIGLSTQVGQVALTKSMQTETASRAASFAYSQIVFAIILGILFYQEIPGLITLLGTALIVLGAYISAVWKKTNLISD